MNNAVINDNDTTLNVSAVSYKDHILNRFTQKIGHMQSIINSKNRKEALKKEQMSEKESESRKQLEGRPATVEPNTSEKTDQKINFDGLLSSQNRRNPNESTAQRSNRHFDN